MEKTVYICDYCHKEVKVPCQTSYGCEVHPECEVSFKLLADRIINNSINKMKEAGLSGGMSRGDIGGLRGGTGIDAPADCIEK